MSRLIYASLASVLLAACGEAPLIDRPPEEAVVDSFEQLKASSIDILFVIDNSRSMREEQEQLASNFSRFLEFIDPDPSPGKGGEPGEVDYRIAVTTTDANRSNGRLIGQPLVLQPGMAYSPLDQFRATIAGIQEGGALEAGFESALLAIGHASELKDGKGEPMFLRPGAFLYVIIVSDEEDGSFGELRYFQRKFETLKGTGNENTVAISAIAGPVPDGCDTAVPGVRYKQMADLTGGVHGSICTDDWGATLEELAVSGIGLRKRFQLSTAPRDRDDPDGVGPEDFESVLVYYPCAYEESDPHLSSELCYTVERSCNGGEGRVLCNPYPRESNGWHFDERENSIVFEGDAVPGPGSTLEVTFFRRDP